MDAIDGSWRGDRTFSLDETWNNTVWRCESGSYTTLRSCPQRIYATYPDGSVVGSAESYFIDQQPFRRNRTYPKPSSLIENQMVRKAAAAAGGLVEKIEVMER